MPEAKAAEPARVEPPVRQLVSAPLEQAAGGPAAQAKTYSGEFYPTAVHAEDANR
jgi:hypothetical protein